jgi:nicotinate phosphoribosyltransferase
MIRLDEVSPYTDQYFINSRIACEKANHDARVVYQVFQHSQALLCGVCQVMQLLVQTSSQVEVYGLEDGSLIGPKESVLHIVGPVSELFELETVYLGLLSRMTRIATNVRAAVEAANGKRILFFPARFDIPEAQEYDGYAAKVGGAVGASTAAEARAFEARALGTMPHALIAAFKGNTVKASLALADALPQEPIWALVDFENDSARTSVEVFRAFRERGLKLSGVRLDTGQDVIDQSLQRIGIDKPGVNIELVREVRRALDEAGGQDVRIAASGGFTAERIRQFEAAQAPVNAYGVGEFFFSGSTPFTSDIVAYLEDGQLVPCAKFGREYQKNPRFKRLK